MTKELFSDISLNRIEKSPNIPSLVAQQIIELIKTGALKSGDRLPSEEDMTIRFGISRISLREAMKLLEAKGYIKSSGRQGKFVQSPERMPLESKIEDMLAVDHEKIWELLAVRRIIDSEAAAMAAVHATEKQIEELAKFETGAGAIGIKNLIPTKEGGRLYSNFYLTLADITNNTILAHVMKSISSMLRGALPYSRQKLVPVPGVSEVFYRHHMKILQAVRSRSPEKAKKLVIEHIDWLEKTLKKILK